MKHCKAAIRQLKEDIPGLQITLLRQRTHLVYELKLGDKVRHLAISASPRDADFATRSAVKDAKHLLGLTK